VSDDVVEAEAVEEPIPAAGDTEAGDGKVRPLPERRPAGELDAWRSEVRAVALAAAGGIAAGAVTVAAVNAVRARAERKRPTRVLRRGGRKEGVLASRSFLIDVHVLGD
jgi:hypothetical protein